MAEFIHECETPVIDENGTPYTATVWAQPVGNVWEAWIEFRDPFSKDVVCTDRETTQSSRADIAYWALGLEPAFLEGAFTRAQEMPELTQA
jgi:hypothetical protein